MQYLVWNIFVTAIGTLCVVVLSLVPWGLFLLAERLLYSSGGAWGQWVHLVGTACALVILGFVVWNLVGSIAGLWDKLVRWRTYVVNFLFAVLLAPELVTALLGFDWGAILPPRVMPYVTLAIIIANIWMRPRPADRASDLDGGK